MLSQVLCDRPVLPYNYPLIRKLRTTEIAIAEKAGQFKILYTPHPFFTDN
ncbi:hypothetical protein [Chroococcidiopsis sp.]